MWRSEGRQTDHQLTVILRDCSARPVESKVNFRSRKSCAVQTLREALSMNWVALDLKDRLGYMAQGLGSRVIFPQAASFKGTTGWLSPLNFALLISTQVMILGSWD